MCGIAGIFNLAQSQPVNSALVNAMTDAMAHRGPNASNFYSFGNVCLGHRRLSIIDLSAAANQPFADSTGRYHLVFNGEIYNYREVKSQIKEYPFRTDSDTEVLIAAFVTWGPSFLSRIEGMFSFAIYDNQTRSIFIARDRLGVKPLYYYKNDNCFVFASEIRGILASGLVPRKLNNSGVAEFLSFQSVGGNISIIENVFQLPAGCYLNIAGQEMSITRYWDSTDLKNGIDFTDKASVLKSIRKLLLQSVEKRLVSDVPLGAFLSGGIDSSAVVGLMAECQSGGVNTFTIGFKEEEYDESKFADLIAKRFNTNHSRILLEPDVFLDEMENALDAMDTPSGDGVNTYVVSKAIKNNGLTVALSGAGGDELFAGYPFFKQYHKIRKLKTLWEPLAFLRVAAQKGINIAAPKQQDKLVSLLGAESCAIEHLYPAFRRILSTRLISTLTRLDLVQPGPMIAELQQLSDKIKKFPDLSQVSLAEYHGYTQHTLLKDMDQMSMAVSLEVREPFFDDKLIEYVLAIPDHLKYPQYPKKLLVEALDGLLPTETVFRPKKGFTFPWNLWMKGSLRSFCERKINEISERDFINEKELRSFWKRFLEGDQRVRWMELWLFVILEHWLQKNKL